LAKHPDFPEKVGHPAPPTLFHLTRLVFTSSLHRSSVFQSKFLLRFLSLPASPEHLNEQCCCKNFDRPAAGLQHLLYVLCGSGLHVPEGLRDKAEASARQVTDLQKNLSDQQTARADEKTKLEADKKKLQDEAGNAKAQINQLTNDLGQALRRIGCCRTGTRQTPR
jgi:hypothetical protein